MALHKDSPEGDVKCIMELNIFTQEQSAEALLVPAGAGG